MIAGVFLGPQIKSVLQDEDLKETFESWETFKWLCENFLDVDKYPAYNKVVLHLLDFKQNLGCSMSLNIHSLHSHLEFIPENFGLVSDEQRAFSSLHPPNGTLSFQSFWNESMMANFCWILYHDN